MRRVKIIRRLFVDITPLRESPAYRRLWSGNMLSSVGGQLTQYATILQIFLLTRSSLAVGLLGLAVAVPTVLVSVAGGAFLDTADRRVIVLVTTSGQAALSALLAAQAFAGLGQVWLLYCLCAGQAVVGGINAPARATFMPRLVRPGQLPAGAALQTLSMYASLTVGPAAAGLITAAAGLRVCYLVDALSFGFALYGVGRLPSMRPQAGGGQSGLRAIRQGLAFVGRKRMILGALVADSSATFFGMPMALFPAINAERFGGHAETLGLLTTAFAAGGIAGSALSGPVSRVRRQGLGMLVAGTLWGAGLVAFGFAGAFWLAFLALAAAGAADVSSVVLRTALVQAVTPDEFQGRVMAVNYAAGGGVPQLGNLRAGIVGDLTSPTVGVVSGGLTAVAGAVVIGLFIPALVAYQAPRAPVRPREPGPRPASDSRPSAEPEPAIHSPALDPSPESGRRTG